ncbi:hypothetical protein Srufu_075160 [Streptomyces libani subsp. rufus]|nr:hypothetical protein Srufu_075160 [Streptomyces libani subsp. rufus]
MEPAVGAGLSISVVRTQRLADGISTAEITKLGDQHYRAKIVARGSVLATLETKGHASASTPTAATSCSAATA